jgi:Ca-activated chloride channel family protein
MSFNPFCPAAAFHRYIHSEAKSMTTQRNPTVLILLVAALAGCGTQGQHTPSGTETPPATTAKPEARADLVEPEAAPAPMPPAPPAPPATPVQAEAMRMAPKLVARVRGNGGYIAMPTPALAVDRENYAHYADNPVHLTAEQSVSTFGIDVDTGSYTNVRRMLDQGQLPPADAVRAEEFINYFDYGYTPPSSRERPFSVTTELAAAPWNTKRQLLLVGIQGYRVPAAEIPASNLVFLVDVSGSMDEPDKLPLLKASLKQLVPQLRARDHVAIVTYAGSTEVVLPSTPGDKKAAIGAAIDQLGAGGSTNGGAGIDLAYAQAQQGFIKGGVNRVILATDGDFNVGTVGIDELKARIVDKRKSGVALTTLGFGQGNYNDAMAVQLADVGNGSHHYIDSLAEGRRVLVDEMSQTLMTIARDVKIQVEFNPAVVAEYRLIGYEKRTLAREDFNNDAVDAGDIGAGANVTALYEITLKDSGAARVDPLRYGQATTENVKGGELGFLRLRYKGPEGGSSQLVEQPLSRQVGAASERLRFAASVAAFADALRGGKYLDGYDYAKIADLASHARGSDDSGYKAGFVQLVRLADGLGTHAPDSGDAVGVLR